jgi:hypothetical protein
MLFGKASSLPPAREAKPWVFPLSQIENEGRTAKLPSKQGTSPEQTSIIEESLFKISSQISSISRSQKYFRTRENRNFSTVNSTETRIINFSMIQIALVICMGGLQVFVVRFFFQVCCLLPRLPICPRSRRSLTILPSFSSPGSAQGLCINASM